MVKTAQVISDNERWLHEPGVWEEIQSRLEESAKRPPQETDLDELERRLLKHHGLKEWGGKRSTRSKRT